MRTSVTHAALLIGAVPVLVAIIAAVWHQAVARPLAWCGFAVSLGGVGLVTAGGGGGGASVRGDGLVLASLVLSAAFTVVQALLPAGIRSRSPRRSSWGPRWARCPSRCCGRARPPSRPGPVPCWP